MTREAFDDIGNAILHLQEAFRKHGLEQPELRLNSAEQGEALRLTVQIDDIPFYADPRLKNVPKNKTSFHGVVIRWPFPTTSPTWITR